MYPRNAASPERIAVGQVILIADGTVQTSGVSITVRGQGGAEAAGSGTTAYGADGTVYYTPTQAETNYTSFVVIAYKASCLSASQTIITTASATSGKVVLSGETHTGAVVPTVSTLTGHTPQTGDSYARLGAPAGASIAADIATVDTVVDGIQTDLSNATDGLGALKILIDAVKTDTAAILIDTNELQTDDVPGLIAALNNISVADVLTTQMTESYNTDGTAPTLAQAIFGILQFLHEPAYSGTTLTIKKLDGTTSAMTFTLDDSTNPTTHTRST